MAVKLATLVIVAVRGFQSAWPPLAYSIVDEDEARHLYALVTTAYVIVTGLVVAGLTLLGRWVVRLLTAAPFYPAHKALPWVALGWALYGLFLVFVTIAGRAKVTTRTFPAAVVGLAVNVVGLALLVGPLGPSGAGIALCASYLAMLVVVHLLTRRLFAVPFDWPRLARDRGDRGRDLGGGRAAAADERRRGLRAAHARPGGHPGRARARAAAPAPRARLKRGLTICAGSVGAAPRAEGRARAPASS